MATLDFDDRFSIVELSGNDVSQQTDMFKVAKELIRSHEQKYPNIENWFNKKVLPNIQHKTRSFFLGFHNGKPIASAVVKKGIDSKFCHLHIDETCRHQNLGDVFFLLMSTAVAECAQKVHFSLPEGLWEEKKAFFNSFGFESIAKYQTQYRKSENELWSSVDFEVLKRRSLAKIPELIDQFGFGKDSPLNGIVMSIHPSYTDQILNGKKEVEIRKKFNKKWKNHRITIYSTSPCKKIVGYAKIKDVIEDNPDVIWSCFSDKLGCSKSEFDDYTKGEDKIFAIVLSEIDQFNHNLSLNYLSNYINKKIHPPQSYQSVIKNDWKQIISVAELLHGRFNVI